LIEIVKMDDAGRITILRKIRERLRIKEMIGYFV
jgi:bifunctional DNA-binding transcriptional regulator/antitoxin component of YhaV-PrlF toxin-antitoxin module